MDIFIENPRPVDKNMGIIILILNIIPIPGLGTLIYNVTTKDDKWINAILPMVFCTLLSLTVVFWVLGLVWAVIDGIKIFQVSQKTATTAPPGPAPTQEAAWRPADPTGSDDPDRQR